MTFLVVEGIDRTPEAIAPVALKAAREKMRVRKIKKFVFFSISNKNPLGTLSARKLSEVSRPPLILPHF